MKIYFISRTLNDAEIAIPPHEINYIPEIGDFVDILTYTNGEDKIVLEKYLKKVNKIVLGRVDGKTLAREESTDILYVSLDFEDSNS